MVVVGRCAIIGGEWVRECRVMRAFRKAAPSFWHDSCDLKIEWRRLLPSHGSDSNPTSNQPAMNNVPYWLEAVSPGGFPALDSDLKVEVLIIGGGVTGLTAAYLMRRAGLEVALIEKHRIGGGESGHTTAHLTWMTDTRLTDLVSLCGENDAALAWRAGRDAMDCIRTIVAEIGCDVELAAIPGHLVMAEGADPDTEPERLRKEVALAHRFGFECGYVNTLAPTGRPGIIFPDQMKFHPLRYLNALAEAAVRAGVSVYEHSAAAEFGCNEVKVNGHSVTFERVMIATHVPLQGSNNPIGATLFQTKIYPFSTYALAARVPAGRAEPMIWSDTADPFLYLRVDRTGDADDLWILGGEDHKTGEVTHTGECFQRLEDALHRMVSDARVTHRWSGQVVVTADGLPYIGSDGHGQFLATGFSGNGYTFGTLAAMMACDAFRGRTNPWETTFALERRKPGGAATYLKENAGFPYHFVKDRLSPQQGTSGDLMPGQGQVFKQDGRRIAACMNQQGELHLVSAVCPHLGCIVAWNEAAQTWDCPCHGSRFTASGEVIGGPAERDLEPVHMPPPVSHDS